MNKTTRWGLVALVLWASGCSSESDDGASGASGAGGASGAVPSCSQLASETYAVLERCSVNFIDTDKATFLAQLESDCETTLKLKGVIPAAYASCVAQRNSKSCDALEDDPCTPKGTLPDGSTCTVGGQCVGGGCTESKDCGECFTYAQAGEACDPDDPAKLCTPGLSCGDDSKCRPLSKLGEACDLLKEFLCQGSLKCVSNKCVQVVGEGGDCPTLVECDFSQDLRCDGTSFKCKKTTRVKAGEPCGTLANGNYAECELTAYCQQPNLPEAGTCQPKRKLGEACGPDDYCIDALYCDGSKCQRFDPTSCL